MMVLLILHAVTFGQGRREDAAVVTTEQQLYSADVMAKHVCGAIKYRSVRWAVVKEKE